jgi:hypothetical protein
MSTKPRTKKPTFKNHERSGPYRSFQNDHADIKLDGAVVGYLSARSISSDVRVTLKVLFPTVGNCGWRNVTLSLVHPDMRTAKAWTKKNWEAITDRYPIAKED